MSYKSAGSTYTCGGWSAIVCAVEGEGQEKNSAKSDKMAYYNRCAFYSGKFSAHCLRIATTADPRLTVVCRKSEIELTDRGAVAGEMD